MLMANNRHFIFCGRTLGIPLAIAPAAGNRFPNDIKKVISGSYISQ